MHQYKTLTAFFHNLKSTWIPYFGKNNHIYIYIFSYMFTLHNSMPWRWSELFIDEWVSIKQRIQLQVPAVFFKLWNYNRLISVVMTALVNIPLNVNLLVKPCVRTPCAPWWSSGPHLCYYRVSILSVSRILKLSCVINCLLLSSSPISCRIPKPLFVLEECVKLTNGWLDSLLLFMISP